MTFTFKRNLMGINKSPRRIKRDAGGRSKKSKAQLTKLLYGEPNSPLYKPKVKPSEKTYLRFTSKKQIRRAEKVVKKTKRLQKYKIDYQ